MDWHLIYSPDFGLTLKGLDFKMRLFNQPFVSSLPWNQRQFLKFFVYEDNPHCFVDILRQIPILQVLHFSLGDLGLWDDLTMPVLWDIFVEMNRLDDVAVENVLRQYNFKRPSRNQHKGFYIPTFLYLTGCVHVGLAFI